MKKKYIEPAVETLSVALESVIATSPITRGDDITEEKEEVEGDVKSRFNVTGNSWEEM